MQKQIRMYLDNREENEAVDFKIEFYSKEKKVDMLKDVLSFANNCKYQDKYIIFGYDNNNNSYNSDVRSCIEDISNYNQLINEYCEPFIDVSIINVDYNGHELAALCIKKNNNNRPYMVKKDYQKNGKIILRKGEIYIRKNANNFICSRDDLDAIYESRKKVLINNTTNEICKNIIRSGMTTSKCYSILVKFINQTTSSVSIDKVEVTVKLGTNLLDLKVLGIEQYNEIYRKKINSISKNPLILEKESQVVKAIIVQISEETYGILFQRLELEDKPIITILLKDLEGKNYTCSFELRNIK